MTTQLGNETLRIVLLHAPIGQRFPSGVAPSARVIAAEGSLFIPAQGTVPVRVQPHIVNITENLRLNNVLIDSPVHRLVEARVADLQKPVLTLRGFQHSPAARDVIGHHLLSFCLTSYPSPKSDSGTFQQTSYPWNYQRNPTQPNDFRVTDPMA